jgi:hypothetical protein
LINVTRTIVIDFRDVRLPAGMKDEEWIPTTLIPALLTLGTGDFVVHITLPRVLRPHYIPGWESFDLNNIQVRGTYVPEHATLSTLFRITRVSIGGQGAAASLGTKLDGIAEERTD